MLVGQIAAGKTSLCQRLNNEELKYHKTQTISILASDVNFIDTPGEYLERRMFRGALMTTAMQADLIVFVQSAKDYQTMFPPNFFSMFPKESVGVVTKIDAAPIEKIETAEHWLKRAGAERVFRVSNVTDEGIPEFLAYLKDVAQRIEGVSF